MNNRNSSAGTKQREKVLGVLLVLFVCRSADAQTFQFLPEIDTHVKWKPHVSFLFQAKQTRENGDPTKGEIGPSLDTYWGPKSNQQLLLLSVGYRYLPSAIAPTTNRVLMVATPRLSLKPRIVISDRNRGELNFSNGDQNWRYRNRLEFEREIAIGGYRPTPYANVEFYYDSKYQKWSSTAIEAGGRFPVQKHAEIGLYYEHQNNTGKAPNRQVNGIGLILNLDF